IDYKEKQITAILDEIGGLLGTYEKGRIYREGVKTTIIGPPNVGKSTLLNILLGQERAIVTDIPGTTRDRIEETANIGGVPVVLVDTAGIRKSEDRVENLGIQFSFQAAREASLVLMVLDASNPEVPDMADILSNIVAEKTLLIMNKTDLGINYSREFIEGMFPAKHIIEVSLKEKNNLIQLEKAIPEMILEGKAGQAADVILSNMRHKKALEKTRFHLNQALESIRNEMPDDFITIDLKTALDAMGEITGKVVYEDLLNRVFNNFCIGK
ncbi:MAG: tRNA modification GTPase, partial [Vulcanimicrobiota bacterium]